MLVTLNEILAIAEEKKCAIGSFNAPNIASIMAVIEAGEELGVPVILMHAQVHDPMAPLDLIGPAMLGAAKKASVPVCVHLDHGETVEYVKRALDLGFTGVMFDGSVLPYEENVTNTKEVVAYAKKTGASVEAEIGVLGKRETGLPGDDAVPAPEEVYTNPDDALRFVTDSGIDALACSFGTAHGLYLKKPKLDFTVLDGVKAKVAVPLVMHGGSGVSREDYKTVIEKGVRKVNYYTYMAKAGGECVQEVIQENLNRETPLPIYFHDLAFSAKDAMKQNALEALKIFNNMD